MKVNYINILGEKHPLCFSLSATEEICERFGDTDGMMSAISSANPGEKVKAIDAVLDILLKAGRRYCAVAGLEMPEHPLPCRPADAIDMTDPEAISEIFSTISGDTQRTVVAKAPKNAPPTPEQ